mmetsp:Transcript_9466/g.31374  ORF Transcript_9466/g.31374 Transcript_9466/m.31374 type:complete len:221 (-) Transcript_9466:1-663(-)
MTERAASSSSASLAAFGRALARASALETICTLMAAARCANRSVLMASSRFSFSHRTVTTIAHWQFPPRESCRMRVSLESRYGTREAPLDASTDTTDERASREMLIRFASSLRIASDEGPASTAADFLEDSMPARSHRVSRPYGSPSRSTTCSATMPWPREERGFICIAATTRLLSPLAIRRITSALSLAGERVRPSGTHAFPPACIFTSRSGRVIPFSLP